MVAQNKDDSKMRKAHHCHGYWYKQQYVATVIETKIVKYG